MREAVRRALPRPRGRVPAPPRPGPASLSSAGPDPARSRSVRPHSEPRAAAEQDRPAPQRPEMQRRAALCLRLWLCLGLLDGERGEPSARRSARLAASGEDFPGRQGRAGHWTSGSLGQQGRGHWEPGDTDAGWSPADRAGARQAEGRVGGDCRRVRHRASSAPQCRDGARGPRSPSTVGGSAPLEPGRIAPHPQRGSCPRLSATRRSPGAARRYAPLRATGTLPGDPRGPQTWVRTSRRLPAAPEIGPPEGARGRCPPSPGQRLRRQGFGDYQRLAPSGGLGAGAQGNLRILS